MKFKEYLYVTKWWKAILIAIIIRGFWIATNIYFNKPISFSSFYSTIIGLIFTEIILFLLILSAVVFINFGGVWRIKKE